MNVRRPMSDYLALDYPFNVIADPDGGYVIRFPDLPGCLTQVETIDEVSQAAAEIKELWIESEYGRGADIPPPSYPEAFSGKFNLRLPRSLHRRLVEWAEAESVSLNQLIVSMLSEGCGASRGAAELKRTSDEQLDLIRSLIAKIGRGEASRIQGADYVVEDDEEIWRREPDAARETVDRPRLLVAA